MPSATFEQLARSPLARRFGWKRLQGTPLWIGQPGNYGGCIAENYPVLVPPLNTASNLTYTPGQVMCRLLRRDCNGGARTDTLPTAAAIVAAALGCLPGDAFDFFLLSDNTSGTGNTITLNPGTGVTLYAGAGSVANFTVAVGNVRQFIVQITNVTPGSEAVLFQSLGPTVVA